MFISKSLLRRALKIPYNNLVRPYLPSKIAVCNGVAVRSCKILDIDDEFPEYEAALIAGIRKHARNGDFVVQIGGGYGPSAVVAAQSVKPEGKVVVYEGGREYVKKIRETLRLNRVTDFVKVELGIVGEAHDVWGETADVDVIEPAEIPDCDVLVLDCEGAEQEILPEFECNPRALIVESHGNLDSPTEDVKQKVENRGYRIESVSEEVPEKDVYVIVATKDGKQ